MFEVWDVKFRLDVCVHQTLIFMSSEGCEGGYFYLILISSSFIQRSTTQYEIQLAVGMQQVVKIHTDNLFITSSNFTYMKQAKSLSSTFPWELSNQLWPVKFHLANWTQWPPESHKFALFWVAQFLLKSCSNEANEPKLNNSILTNFPTNCNASLPP